MADESPETEDAPRPVAFISHHSSQEQTARHLKTILERNGITGWMAPDDIEPGIAFDQAILEQVERTDAIILLFCARSDQSRHVKRELMLAEESSKPIYPVRLEDVDAKGLAYWLKDYQWIDWIDGRDATIQKLVETIKRQAGIPTSKPATALQSGTYANRAPRSRFKRIPFWAWLLFVLALGIGIGVLAFRFGTSNDYDRRFDEPYQQGFSILPGRWEGRADVVAIPNVPTIWDENERLSYIDGIESAFSVDTCISEDNAETPNTDFFMPNPDADCIMDNFVVGRGRISLDLYCRPNTTNEHSYRLHGSYSQDSAIVDVDVVDRTVRPVPLELRMQLTSRRTGSCN